VHSQEWSTSPQKMWKTSCAYNTFYLKKKKLDDFSLSIFIFSV